MSPSLTRRVALASLALSVACGPAQPSLEMLHVVHAGAFVALIDGGPVLYALGPNKLHIFSRGVDSHELGAVAIPPGLMMDLTGDGALLLDGNTLYGALPTSSFAFDVTDRNAPALLYQDKTSGGGSLALHAGVLYVALGTAVTAYDVSDPKAWRRTLGSPNTEPGATTFIGPQSMALDAARGLVVVAGRDGLEVRRAADLVPVRQGDVTGFATPVWSVVGVWQRALLVCAAQEGLRSIALSDDGVLGAVTTIDPTPCNGTLTGDVAWLGLPNTASGQRPFLGRFGYLNLKGGTLASYTLSAFNVVDPSKAPMQARYGVGAFKGVVQDGELAFVNMGEIWVVGPRR